MKTSKLASTACAVIGAFLAFDRGSAWAATRPPGCGGGVYLATPLPLIDSAATDDGRIVIKDQQISIGTSCPPTIGRVRAGRTTTIAKVVFPGCTGLVGRVRFRAKIDASCQTMPDARLTAPGFIKRFTANEIVARPEVSVDAAVQSPREGFPAPDGNMRTVARLIGDDGRASDFVEDELIISTDDDALLSAFVARHRGMVLQTTDFRAGGLEQPRQHVIRIDTTTGAAAELVPDLRRLEPEGTGVFRVSSPAAVGLLAAAAREAARGGLTVSVNWLLEPQALPYGSTTEAPVRGDVPIGVAGQLGLLTCSSGTCPYSPNTDRWNYLNAGSIQDIGVTEAWRAMARDPRYPLANRVGLAILDGGFDQVVDFTYANALSVSGLMPFAPNALQCRSATGPFPCPWHGMNVASAAMGTPDDRLGSAGPAGPIANAITVQVGTSALADFMDAIPKAALAGARVVNMSIGAQIDNLFAFTMAGLSNTTRSARDAGMLLFAAAGNAGADVDGSDWFMPCENDGVICVGALAVNAISRRTDSNFASRDQGVAIFGPGTVFVGPDPALTATSGLTNYVQAAGGTSISSPFVAGVAALVWAANPNLTDDQVEGILLLTAHSSTDGTVRRYVDAEAAVLRALGNTPPRVTITSPASGVQVRRGDTLILSATATDAEDRFLTPAWESDRDGFLGTGDSLALNYTLSAGLHRIRASVMDSFGAFDDASIEVEITDTFPSISIIEPISGAEFGVSESIRLRASSYDYDEVGRVLPDSSVRWELYPSATALGRGHQVTIQLLAGTHTIVAIGTDSAGQEARAYVTIAVRVLADPPPIVVIDTPSEDTTLIANGRDSRTGWGYVDVRVSGLSYDEWTDSRGRLVRTDVPSLWYGTVNGLPLMDQGTEELESPCEERNGVIICWPYSITRYNLDLRLYTAGPCGGGGWTTHHTVHLSGTDSADNTRTATRRISVTCWAIN